MEILDGKSLVDITSEEFRGFWIAGRFGTSNQCSVAVLFCWKTCWRDFSASRLSNNTYLNIKIMNSDTMTKPPCHFFITQNRSDKLASGLHSLYFNLKHHITSKKNTIQNQTIQTRKFTQFLLNCQPDVVLSNHFKVTQMFPGVRLSFIITNKCTNETWGRLVCPCNKKKPPNKNELYAGKRRRCMLINVSKQLHWDVDCIKGIHSCIQGKV